jgi:membrane fusion protein YbhG
VTRLFPPFRLALCAALAACSHEAPNTINGTGSIEVTEIDVAPMVPARVKIVLRREGETVSKNDTLLVLTQPTSRPEIEAQRGQLAASQARLRDLEAGPRPAEIGQAESQLLAAEAEVTRTAKDLERIAPLGERAVVSKQQVDAARAAARIAVAQRDGAAEHLRLVKEGARPQEIVAARAQVESARAGVSKAVRTAADLVLTAPVNGLVLSRHAEPGEVLGAGMSAMTLSDASQPYIRIYVGPKDFPLIRVGDSATATLDAFPKLPFVGRVVALSDHAEFTPRVALTEEERADLVFGVKVALVDSAKMLKSGLPATVRIPRRSAPATGR